MKIHLESLYLSNIPHSFRLLKDTRVTLRTGVKIVIPKGYVTDFATVPRALWGIVIPVGRHNGASLIHDYLLDSGWNRREADKEFYYWLEVAKVSKIKKYLMYITVCLYTILKSQ